MAEEAEAIHAGRLDSRLPIDNPHDEPGRLAFAFNALLARLEAAFGELRRFTADASHELRTPLTVIRSVGEVALREPHSETEYRDIIGTMLEEVDRLTLLTTLLLELTRAEGGQAAMKCEAIDLRELVRDAAGFLGVLAEEERVRIELDLPATVVPVTGDWMMLRQAIVNLLDNAIKHSPPVRPSRLPARRRVNRWKSASAIRAKAYRRNICRMSSTVSTGSMPPAAGRTKPFAADSDWAWPSRAGRWKHTAGTSRRKVRRAKAAYSESHCLAKELSCIQKEPRHEVSRCGYRSCTHRRLRYTPRRSRSLGFPQDPAFSRGPDHGR
jgi:hypothetical protein